MIQIKFLGRTPTPSSFRVGMETDSNAEMIVFDLPEVTENQSSQLLLLLPDGEPETLLMPGNSVLLPSSVLSIPGKVRGWVEILGSDRVVWNSEPFTLEVGNLPPVEQQIEKRYPTALQNAMDASTEAIRYHEKTKLAAELVLAGSELWSIRVEDTKLIIDHALPDDAYAIAVRNGYEGTREQWEALISEVADHVSADEAKTSADAAQEDVDNLEETVDLLSDTLDDVSDVADNAKTSADAAQEAADNAQAAADAAQETAGTAQEAADAAQETANSKAAVTSANIVIPATSWSNSAPYTATINCSIVDENGNYVVGASKVTSVQADEFATCGIFCTAQGDGTLTLMAIYKKPSIDLPISVLGVN
jgi:hypothetical protein